MNNLSKVAERFIIDNLEVLLGIGFAVFAITFYKIYFSNTLNYFYSSKRKYGHFHADLNMQNAEAYQKSPKLEPLPRLFTLDELKRYNAESSEKENEAKHINPIYISILGIVYDVTSHPSGLSFYGKNGPYRKFGGCDATINLAKMILTEIANETSIPSKWLNLTLNEKSVLTDWIKKFEEKYDVVGYVDFKSENENEIFENFNKNSEIFLRIKKNI